MSRQIEKFLTKILNEIYTLIDVEFKTAIKIKHLLRTKKSRDELTYKTSNLNIFSLNKKLTWLLDS